MKLNPRLGVHEVLWAIDLVGDRLGMFDGTHTPLAVGSQKWQRWYQRAVRFLLLMEERRQPGYRVTEKGKRPRCGARCRDGHTCQARPVWDRGRDAPRNGRCRMHGGLSTGPRTPEGKARAREAGLRGARVSAEGRRGKRGLHEDAGPQT